MLEQYMNPYGKINLTTIPLETLQKYYDKILHLELQSSDINKLYENIPITYFKINRDNKKCWDAIMYRYFERIISEMEIGLIKEKNQLNKETQEKIDKEVENDRDLDEYMGFLFDWIYKSKARRSKIFECMDLVRLYREYISKLKLGTEDINKLYEKIEIPEHCYTNECIPFWFMNHHFTRGGCVRN